MELEEAYKKIDISFEEYGSIERYLGFNHTSINILADLTPKRYQSLSNSGWKLPENEGELKSAIADFVNIYSAMYKDSKGRGIRTNLIRGTGNNDVPKGTGVINQLISTTTDEEIAKRFCKYGDAALVRFKVGEGVPFIIAEDYRDENSATENEVLLAPFCNVTRSERTSQYNGYDYYDVYLEKPTLEELPQKQIDILMKDIVSSFSQNITDMQTCNEAADKYEFLGEKLNRTFDKEEKDYIAKKKEEAFEEYSKTRIATTSFKEKLTKLLKGLCKQKELEIDKAHEVIEIEKQRIAEEAKKQEEAEKTQKEILEKESKRKKLYIELSSKSLKSPAEAQDLQNTLINTYESLIKIEENSIMLAAKLGVPYTKTISSTDIKEKIASIQENIAVLQSKIDEVKISEDHSLEYLEETKETSGYAFDGISYGLEIARDMPQAIGLYQMQSDREIKKNLYFKVQNAIQDARVQKYLKDRDTISEEGIGFFSGFTRKSDLQIERLNNVNLKIQMAQVAIPEEQEEYSVRSMLADLYTCATVELGGNFTPKMQDLYDMMKSVYKDTNTGEFTDDYIGKLARDKIIASQKNLPVIQEPKKSFFGRRKNQIELLRAENKGLEIQIAEARSKSKMDSYVVEEVDALNFLDVKLRGIAFATKDKSQTKEDKVLEDTAPLWE